MKMKKVFYLVLSALCLFTACGDDDDPNNNSSVTKITLNQSTLSVEVGGTGTLTATFEPEGATAAIQWESSNSDVATVTSGVVIGVREGTAVITAKAGGLTDNCVVTVVSEIIPPVAITLNTTSTTLSIGTTETLVATLLPAGAIGDITWTSSAPAVATVNNGVVTALAEGSTTITATCNALIATCVVTVGTGTSGDNCLNGSNYYALFLDATTFDKISSKVVADLRPDEADAVVDIWPGGDSYSEAPTSGPNAFGVMDGWISLRANQTPWDGTGAGGIRQIRSFDLTGIDESYTFHCALKSRDGVNHEICLFSEDGNETWKVLPSYTDNEWHHYEIPMIEFIDAGWTFPRPYTLTGDGRYTIGFRTKGVGAILQLDAVFIYKK